MNASARRATASVVPHALVEVNVTVIHAIVVTSARMTRNDRVIVRVRC